MCGIIGSINFSNPLNLTSIAHRGPDASGIFEEDNLKLGHVRLSIQDLSERGHQPLFSADNNFLIVFNGEIYNHWEIRKELERKGYRFQSTSDTETVLYGFVEYGLKILEKLNGIFAFTIYDRIRKRIVCARDRFGIKPFYYLIKGDQFVFSSELKALVPYCTSPMQIDPTALSNYLRFLWSPGDVTPSVEIKKLLPGRFLQFELNDCAHYKIGQFYQSGFNSNYSSASEEDLINQLDTLLTNAVERQLLSDVPVGFFLSGGLDSSLLVAIAKKLQPLNKLQCFTIETASEHDSDILDIPYARKVAEHLNVNLEVVKADINIVRDFDKMIYHLDEPQADAAPLNVFNISRRAKEMGYKVLIGGTAGDDLFSGYRRHQALHYERYLNNIPSFLKPSLLKLSSSLKTNRPFNRRLKKLVNTLSYTKDDRLFSYFEWLSNDAAVDLFTPAFKENLKGDPFSYFKKILAEIPNEKNILNKLLHLEMGTFLVDHNLNYTDKMGMAVGVEIRVPFLDNDLVDFSFTIPPHLKMNRKNTKYILKKVAERYLPKEVIYRTKTGFGAPVRRWIKNDLQPMIDQRLSAEKISKRGIFDPDKVEALIKRNQSGEVDASYSIWALLAIESWFEMFIDASTSTPATPMKM